MVCIAYIPYGAAEDRVVFFCGENQEPDPLALCSHSGCSREAVVLCDAKGCDKPLCLAHSAQVGEGKHYCRVHAIYFGDLPLGRHRATMPNDLTLCQGKKCDLRVRRYCAKYSRAKPSPSVLFWDGYEEARSVGRCKYFEHVDGDTA